MEPEISSYALNRASDELHSYPEFVDTNANINADINARLRPPRLLLLGSAEILGFVSSCGKGITC